jgi:hypothetical protein
MAISDASAGTGSAGDRLPIASNPARPMRDV